MQELMSILSKIIFVTIVITIVLAIMSYSIYKIREKQKPKVPKREWTLPDEADSFNAVLFERIDWSKVMAGEYEND